MEKILRFTMTGIVLLLLAVGGQTLTASGAEDMIVKNAEGIEEIKTRLDSISGELNELEDEIASLIQALTDMKDDFAAIETQVDPLQEKTADLEFKLKEEVGKLSSRIGDLERDRAAEVIEVNEENWMKWQEMAAGQVFGDFALQVSIKQVEGSPAYYGILFRYQDAANYYQFWVSDDGYYGLAVSEAGEWNVLIEMNHSRAIEPGDWNRLDLIASGSSLSLYVNGVLLDDIEDNTFREGKVAVSAETGVDQNHMKVLFDGFAIDRLE
ncbi:MAG: family 16 glycoside hydrolase [Candidatus Acetothermia bacterium]